MLFSYSDLAIKMIEIEDNHIPGGVATWFSPHS